MIQNQVLSKTVHISPQKKIVAISTKEYANEVLLYSDAFLYDKYKYIGKSNLHYFIWGFWDLR